MPLQLIHDVSSTYAGGLSSMRYEHYCSIASLQRSKALFNEINKAQKEAIKRILSTCGVESNVLDFIDPIFEVTQSLLPKQTETRMLDKEIVSHVGPNGYVSAHARSLGQVKHTVKVRPHRLHHIQTASHREQKAQNETDSEVSAGWKAGDHLCHKCYGT